MYGVLTASQEWKKEAIAKKSFANLKSVNLLVWVGHKILLEVNSPIEVKQLACLKKPSLCTSG